MVELRVETASVVAAANRRAHQIVAVAVVVRNIAVAAAVVVVAVAVAVEEIAVVAAAVAAVVAAETVPAGTGSSS